MTHSCIIFPILETKLPPELSEKWELELNDIKEESVDLELFLTFLNKQAISKEAEKRNVSMTGEDDETARGSGGRDKDGTGVKNTREKKSVFTRCSTSKWDESEKLCSLPFV